MGNCHPEKTNVDRGEAEQQQSRAVNIFINISLIEEVNLWMRCTHEFHDN